MTRFLDGINLEQTEIQNARLQNLAGAPVTPVEGQIYYDSIADIPYCYTGGGWVPMTGTHYQRAYNPATTYAKNDFVTYNGSTYIVITPGAAGTVPTDTTHWDLLSEGGVSATSYTNATPLPIAFGGLPAGQTFDHMPITDVLNKWLYPYQSPGFSTFTMTGLVSTVEVGTALSGSKTFTWSTVNPANVTPGSVTILQGATVLASGLNSSGTTTVPITSVTNTTPATVTFTIRGTNTNGVQFSTSFSVTWQYKKYYGTSTVDVLDGAGVQALASNALGSSTGGTYAFAAGGYKYFAIPASFSAVASIKDAATLLAVAMASTTENAFYNQGGTTVPYGTLSVTNSLGVTTSYRVYRTRFQLGDSYNYVVA